MSSAEILPRMLSIQADFYVAQLKLTNIIADQKIFR